jgi:hypothetical protein
MNRKQWKIVQKAALLDVARNIAAIDDDWLAKAHPRLLRAAIKEIRTDARAALDKQEESP